MVATSPGVTARGIHQQATMACAAGRGRVLRRTKPLNVDCPALHECMAVQCVHSVGPAATKCSRSRSVNRLLCDVS